MKLFKLARPLLAVLTLVLASLACEFGGPPAIGEVVVAKSLTSDYKPVEPVSKYTSDDTVISISVEVQNIKAGSVVEVRYKLDGKDYDKLSTTADKAGSGYYGFTLTFENGIVPGSYVADVYLDNTLAKSVSFTVEPSGPPTIGDVVTAKSLDENYKPVDPTSTYAPNDTINISIKVKDLVVGSSITVKYGYDGQHIDSADTNLVADKAGSGYYGFTLTPPTDGFPSGSYTADVYLNDVLASTVEFSVP